MADSSMASCHHVSVDFLLPNLGTPYMNDAFDQVPELPLWPITFSSKLR
jgi:hypothetical protein